MSTSRSFSSYVKNPYANSCSSWRNPQYYDSDFEYKFNGVKCKCDLPSPCKEAWKEGTLDPGRRFFGCSQYKDPRRKCNFFIWADPPYTERAREIIRELKEKVRAGEEVIESDRVDINFMDRKVLVLNEECVALRKKHEEASQLLKKKEKEARKLKKLLVIVVLCWFMFNIFSAK